MNASQPRPVATLLDPQDDDLTPLPWEEARARIDAARFYFLTTLHTSGRPQTRPVLAVWAASWAKGAAGLICQLMLPYQCGCAALGSLLLQMKQCTQPGRLL